MKMPQIQSITERIRGFASEAGFESCGVVPMSADGGIAELQHFADWIAAGRAGEMTYLEARNEAGELKRAALRNVAPWARSVIVCAINYNTDKPYSTEVVDSGRGWISRYAWFGTREGEKATDYHDAVLARLKQVESELQKHAAEFSGDILQTRCYVDTGPIVERVFAKYAGTGWLAKNTCVINQQYGSWLFLGTILTSIELREEEAKAVFANVPADRCGSCTRCIEACPTNALVTPYQMDARRCISYLTIEKRGSIPEEFRAQMATTYLAAISARMCVRGTGTRNRIPA